MRCAVIGVGAMGGLIAHLLHEAGVEVAVYERREEKLAELRESGIRVRGALQGEAFPEIVMAGKAAAPFDVIILAVSAMETGAALRPVSPFVHRDSIYVSLQDGNAVSALAGLVGEERTYAMLSWVSACENREGEAEVEDLRSLVLGSFVPERKTEIAGLADALEVACPGRIDLAHDLGVEMWRRLEAAAAVSGICAIAGAVPQEAQELEGLSALCEEAASECRQASCGARREDPAPISPWEDAVWDRVKPPMLRDIEAGRKTEAAFMSGYIVQQARSLGKRAPVHSAVFSLVREIEAGVRGPGEPALKELNRRIGEERGMSLL